MQILERIVNDRLTINGEVEPRAIVSRIRRSIGEDHLTFVPALIAFANIREIYTTLTIPTMAGVVQQMYATLVTIVHSRLTVVPREYRATLKLKLVVNNENHLYSGYIIYIY